MYQEIEKLALPALFEILKVKNQCPITVKSFLHFGYRMKKMKGPTEGLALSRD
jgi:hypothetical protein